jgi:cobalt-zinc-cadmium efflux system outer membrane protein
VRKAFVDVITAGRRRNVLTARRKEVEKALEEAKKRVQVLPEEGSEIVPLTFQYELDRIGLELATAEREYAAAWTRLAAVIGSPGLAAPTALASPFLDRLPVYAVHPDARKNEQNLADLRRYVIANHPEVRFAEVGIAKADAALGRARAQAVPNITIGGGYQRNFNDREHQAMYQVAMPIPLFNRNQGGIREAQAVYGRAVREVDRTELDLSQRLATAYGEYTTATLRAAESNKLRAMSKKIYDQASTLYFKAGKLSNFQIIQYQRQMIDAELEHIRAWGDAWRAASEIGGLMLDEDWPGVPNQKE